MTYWYTILVPSPSAPTPIKGQGKPPRSFQFPSLACGGRVRDGGEGEKGLFALHIIGCP